MCQDKEVVASKSALKLHESMTCDHKGITLPWVASKQCSIVLVFWIRAYKVLLLSTMKDFLGPILYTCVCDGHGQVRLKIRKQRIRAHRVPWSWSEFIILFELPTLNDWTKSRWKAEASSYLLGWAYCSFGLYIKPVLVIYEVHIMIKSSNEMHT